MKRSSSVTKPRFMSSKSGSFQKLATHYTHTESTEPSTKAMLSDKVPFNVSPFNIELRPVQVSYENETKMSLYSEIERLTVFNFELKMQIEALVRDMELQRRMVSSVPDLENENMELRGELRVRDNMINSLKRDLEKFALENRNFANLEKVYTDSLNHNAQLIEEIDRLNSKINELNSSKDVSLNEISIYKNYEKKYYELNRDFELLSNELRERNKQATKDREQYYQDIQEHQQRLEEAKLAFKNELTLVVTKMETEKKSSVDDVGRVVELKNYEIENMKNEFIRYKEASDKNIEEMGNFNKYFQSEIERLKQEIDRVKIEKDSEISKILDQKIQIDKELIKERKERDNEKKLAADSKSFLEREIQSLKDEKELERRSWTDTRGIFENEINKLKTDRDNERRQLFESYNTLDKEYSRYRDEREHEIKGLIDANAYLENEISKLKEEKEFERRSSSEVKLTLEREIERIKRDTDNERRLLVESCANLERQIAKKAEEHEIEKNELIESKNEEKRIEIERHNSLHEEKAKGFKHTMTRIEDEKNRIAQLYSQDKTNLEKDLLATKNRLFETENKLSLMTMEVERLNLLIQEKTLEFENNYAVNSRTKDIEIATLRDKVHDLEAKLGYVVEENSKLSIHSEERKREVDGLKHKINQQEDRHSKQLEEIQRNYEASLNNTIENEISVIVAKDQLEIATHQNKIFELNQNISNLEKKNEFQANEIARLNSLIKNQQDIISAESARFATMETQRNEEIQQLKQHYEGFKKTGSEWNIIISKLEAEKNVLNAQVSHLREQVTDTEKRLVQLIADNEKLRINQVEKSAENEKLFRRVEELELLCASEAHTIENHIASARKVNDEVSSFTQRFNIERNQYENQIRQLKHINESHKLELENLYKTLEQRKLDQEIQHKAYDELRRQHDKVLVHLGTSSSDLGKSPYGRNDDFKLQRKIDDLEEDRNFYKQQAENLNTELSRMAYELKNKTRDIEVMRQKYERTIDYSSSK